MDNRLVIVGGGAAGLFAAVTAGEMSVPAMVLERRHRPGLKLLITGNNRCNLSHLSPVDELVRRYGDSCGDFLRPALEALPPAQLRGWLQRNGLATVVKKDGRVYPFSEKADDVLHYFLDRLRDLSVPLALNSAVQRIEKRPEGGFAVVLENGIALTAQNVLLATGGVSYPKTGSVGDGQRIAAQLGHTVTPLRPGLAGVELAEDGGWLTCGHEDDIPAVQVGVWSRGRLVQSLAGNILCCGSILRGSAIFDAASAIAHRRLDDFELRVDFAPGVPVNGLNAGLLSKRLPPALLNALRRETRRPEELARLKDYRLPVVAIRPLKEAIVTIGGVALDEVEPRTMESRLCKGLYFAGELLDVDGPTGGYNLQAAFATARLAVRSIAGVRQRPAGEAGSRRDEAAPRRPSAQAAGRDAGRRFFPSRRTR